MAETLPALPVDLSDLAARAAEFARSSRSAATERAYRSDWADFSGWCGRAGLSPLPATPATVGAYLSARAGELKVATLNRRVAAITVVHRTAGLGLAGGKLTIYLSWREVFTRPPPPSVDGLYSAGSLFWPSERSFRPLYGPWSSRERPCAASGPRPALASTC